MAFPDATLTDNEAAGAYLINKAMAAGLDLSGLQPVAQLQCAVGNLLVSDPSTVNVPAGDVLSGTFGANKSGGADTGTYGFPGAFTFVTKGVSTTAFATPAALAATAFNQFASTVSGATLMGFGSTADVTLKNRAGTDALYVVANTTGVIAAGVFSIQGASLTLSAAGAAFALQGTTTALTADAASGAITIKGNVGTGAGAVGGFVFQIPVTHGSDSVAQTLTTVLTLSATTVVSATFAGALAITGALTGVTTAAISTSATVTSASAVALAVGLAGATNSAFVVDASTGSQAAGLKVTGATAAGTVAVAVISSGATANLTLNALGTGGTLGLQTAATGQVNIGRGAVVQPIMSGAIGSLGTTQNSSPTIAQLLAGIVTQTGQTGAGTVTLPTGTAIDTAVTGAANGDTFDCHFFNLAGGFNLVITAGASGSTVVGNATVPSGKSVLLRFIRTGSTAWSTYCIVGA